MEVEVDEEEAEEEDEEEEEEEEVDLSLWHCIGICKCKFKLVARMHVVRNGLRVCRIMKFIELIEPDFILQLIEQHVVFADAADLLASGVCFKCMKEVGMQAHEIIAL